MQDTIDKISLIVESLPEDLDLDIPIERLDGNKYSLSIIDSEDSKN